MLENWHFLSLELDQFFHAGQLLDEGKFRSITDIAAAEGIDVTQARRLLRLTLLAPAVVEPLLANPDVAINLESVLRRVMPLDWREQGAVFVRR